MIIKTNNLVHEILKTDKEARCSDNILYLRVLQSIGKSRGIDVSTMSVPTLFTSMRKLSFPAFETVRRTRQKLQEVHPELRADGQVEAYRTVLEDEYRDYARRHTV